MPPAVRSSASRRLTTILSLRGTTFIPWSSSGWKRGTTSWTRRALGSGFVAWLAVEANQGARDRVEDRAAAHRLVQDAVGVGLAGLEDQGVACVGGDKDARQQGTDL